MPRRAKETTQLALPTEELSSSLRARFDSLRETAARLPPDVFFGTSSWSFPGWGGIVFPEGMSETKLARDGLPFYVRHPLLRTVGIDRSYYAPLASETLATYATQLPWGFPCCAKVPEMFCCPIHLGYRGPQKKGESNPFFLDAEEFNRVVAEPFLVAFREHMGPFILEFPPVPRAHRLSPAEFCKRLDDFLSAVSPELQFGVELRDSSFLTPQYAEVLRAHKASHVYNYCTAMPMPAVQQNTVPLGTASFVMIRLLMRPGTRYEKRQADFSPFDKLVDQDPEMRQQVVDLMHTALARGCKVYVLVNNKAEGSAPLTIEALAQLLVQGDRRDTDMPYS